MKTSNCQCHGQMPGFCPGPSNCPAVNQQWLRFNRWFSEEGHWIYTRDAAIEAWQTTGIDGLPDYEDEYI